MAERRRETTDTARLAEQANTTTTTAAPEQKARANAGAKAKEVDPGIMQDTKDRPFEAATDLFAIAIPAAAEKYVDSVEVEFVHDGKGEFKAPSVGYKGAKVSERVQQGAPPHAIVVVRAKAPERDEDTGIRSEDRTLDFTGAALSYAVGNVGGLALNERNSIPLLGTLPAGDAPKAVSEGLVATG